MYLRIQVYVVMNIYICIYNCVCVAGLESVDHYPILVAVTGILVRILVDGDRQG